MNKERRRLPRYVVEYKVKGVPFVYFRRKGEKDVRMHGTPYSDEWMELYHKLVAGERPAEMERVAEVKDGTLAWLCHQYFASPKFNELDERTKRVRRGIIKSCLEEPVKPGGAMLFADVPFKQITPKAVAVLRDRKKDFPEAGNGRVKAIRVIFTWAGSTEVNLCLTNPARDIQILKKHNPDGHHSWTIEEVEMFEARHPVGSKARLALALLLYTGQRRSDVVLMGRQHERNGWLIFNQQKNLRNKVNSMEIPIRPELRAVLDASPVGDMVYLVTEFGKPFTANGFGNWFRERCDEVGERDADGKPPLLHCSAHGLRKAAATRLANAGASVHEIMAITGHLTTKEVERYTKAADRRKLAESASLKG